MAAEARHIEFRIGDERGSVALVAKAPDHPREAILVVIPPRNRGPIDEIGDWIEAEDGEPAVAVGHHLLGRCRPAPGNGAERACKRGTDNEHGGGPPSPEQRTFLPTPPCGHSLADDAAIRLRFGRKARVAVCATG